MTNLPLSLMACNGIDYTPTTFLMRVGRREMLVCRDYRNRYYSVNPLVDISTGIEAGHLEILLFHKWLVILSKSR